MIAGGAIIGIIGPEGAGKTSLLTAFSVQHKASGGNLYAFPGYHVYDLNGKEATQTILPEEWATIPETLNFSLVAITEADTFFDSLETQAATAKAFRNLAKQRRKRSMSIMYDVNDWSWFNNRLRKLTHILIKCWDLHWTYRNSPDRPAKGTRIAVTPYDVQGFYTGRPGSRGRTRLFDASKVRPFFNTEDAVDAYEAAVKLKVKRREVTIGPDGKVIVPGADTAYAVNDEAIARLAQSAGYSDPSRDAIKKIIDGLRGRGITRLPADDLRQFISSQGISVNSNTLGKILRADCGVSYHDGKRGSQNEYRL